MAEYDSALPIRTQLVDGDSVSSVQDLFVIAGTDGSNYQAISTDSSGVLNTNATFSGSLPAGTNDIGIVHLTDGTTEVDVAVDGAAAKTNGFQVLGTDGTNAQILSTDTSGVLNVNAALSWDDTNKVYIWDGTTDLSVAIDGSAAKTNGVQILGSDGTNAQILKTDSNGQLYVLTDGSPDDSLTYGTANLVKSTATTVVSQAGAAVVAKVQASGSGLFKCEVKYGTTGSEAVIAVLINSTANPNVEYEFPNGLSVASGETILLSCTNLERAPSPASDFSGYGSIAVSA